MWDTYVEMKRKIRKLKNLEIKIRFGNIPPETLPPTIRLVWNSFFDLHNPPTGKGRYSLKQLAAMDKEEYQRVIDEFFSCVYYGYYRENGIVPPCSSTYDPHLLAKLNLPFDANAADIKKRFHELAMKHHPDTGGDAREFIQLMDNYRKLIEKGQSF